MAHEGVPLVVIQRQLGHANLGITSVYLQGISSEIIDTVPRTALANDLRASAGLQIRRLGRSATDPAMAPQAGEYQGPAHRRRDTCCDVNAVLSRGGYKSLQFVP